MSNRSSVVLGNGGVSVDIGERDMFYVELDCAECYEEIHRSISSVVFVVHYTNEEKIILRVSWSRYKRIAQGRGYAGMVHCSSLSYVPEMYSRVLTTVGRTYVEVSTRQYMEGRPLSEVWSSMPLESRLQMFSGIEDVIGDMSEYTSETFMQLQGRNLSQGSAVQYMNYRILLSMISKDLEKGDMRILDMEEFPHTAVLCHANLSMDHIIVTGSVISGVVGWSQCDYIPEVMDRMKYQFIRPVRDGESEWYQRISLVQLYHYPPPPLYTVSCMYYNYHLRLKSTPKEHHWYLERKLSETSSAIIPSVRKTYMGFDAHLGGVESDHRSQRTHSDISDDTENPFASDSGTTDFRNSIATWEEWEDNETVLGILDSLSVL